MGVLPRRCGISTFCKRGHVYIHIESVGHASASEWWTSSCRVPRQSQSASPVQANGGPAHAGCPATVSRPRQCKRMVDQLMQGAPSQSVGLASASEWWTSSCRVPRQSQSASPVQANGGPAHAGCPATVSRPRQCKRMVDQLMQGAPSQSVGLASASEWWTSSCRVPRQSVGLASASEWWTSSCRVPRHSQSASPVQANGGPAHAGCPARVSRPRQCKRMVDQLMQGAPPQSVGHASASEWWTSSCRVPRHSQSASPVQANGGPAHAGCPASQSASPVQANGGPAHAGCPVTVSRPRQCKRMVDQLMQGAPPVSRPRQCKRMVDQLMQGAPSQSVGLASASEWWTSSCRVPRHSQSASPVQANGGPAHAGCPATVSRPRQGKRMVDQLMQGAPSQSVGHASASEWWTSSCRVPRQSVGHASASEWWTSSCRVTRHSQSATTVQGNGGPAHAGCPATVSRPRQCKRMVDQLMQGAPPQSVSYASASGWTDAGLFLKWMEHFVLYINTSTQNRHLIVLDEHHSHKTLDAVNYARAHGIELVILPPHCTHKIQPLDRCFFKSLKRLPTTSLQTTL